MGRMLERWAPLSGAVFVVLFLVAFLVAGDPPNADSGVAAIRSYYADDGALLTATYLTGLGLFMYLSFVGTLAHRLREAGEARLAAVAFAGGITLAALHMTGVVAGAVLAYRTPADDAVVQALYDVRLLSFLLTNSPGAVLVGATAVAATRTGLFPRWFNGIAAVAALAFLVDGAGFAAGGFFSPGGGYGLTMRFVFLAWAAAASGFLTMRAQAEEAHTPATAPM